MFQTTHGTLLSDQNSMLAKKNSTGANSGIIPAIQDENGAYFIDGCPKYFGIILNFLRSGIMGIGANVNLRFLHREAEHFLHFRLG